MGTGRRRVFTLAVVIPDCLIAGWFVVGFGVCLIRCPVGQYYGRLFYYCSRNPKATFFNGLDASVGEIARLFPAYLMCIAVDLIARSWVYDFAIVLF